MVFLRNFPKLGCRTLAVFGLLRWFTFFNRSLETLYGRFVGAPVFFSDKLEKIAARSMEGETSFPSNFFCLELWDVLMRFFAIRKKPKWITNSREENKGRNWDVSVYSHKTPRRTQISAKQKKLEAGTHYSSGNLAQIYPVFLQNKTGAPTNFRTIKKDSKFKNMMSKWIEND